MGADVLSYSHELVVHHPGGVRDDRTPVGPVPQRYLGSLSRHGHVGHIDPGAGELPLRALDRVPLVIESDPDPLLAHGRDGDDQQGETEDCHDAARDAYRRGREEKERSPSEPDTDHEQDDGEPGPAGHPGFEKVRDHVCSHSSFTD